MSKLFKYLDSVTDWLEVTATSIMVIAIFIQVIWRYFLNNALPWPEEIARYLFCWGTYLAVAISMRGDENLRITILLDALPNPLRKTLNMLCCTVNILFFTLLVYLGFDITFQVKELEEYMVSMPVPIWYIWLGLPISFILITIQAIRNLFLIATDQIGQPYEQG